MSEYLNLEDLVGKIFTAAKYDGESIYLLGEESFGLYPEGDCCANCYIQHVNFPEVLVNATIVEVEDIDVPLTAEEEAKQSYWNTIDSWGHRIHTTKGICTIEMRVSHNGYYGGRLSAERLKKDVGSMPDLSDF